METAVPILPAPPSKPLVRSPRKPIPATPSEDEAGKKRKGRGAAFTSHEALTLAQKWVEQTGVRGTQNEDSFWTDVEDRCRAAGMNRTGPALKTQWSYLQRNARKYIQAHADVVAMGVADAELSDRAMKLFRERAGSKDADGRFQLAPCFKYTDAAVFLAEEPCFTQKYSGKPMQAVSRPSDVKENDAGGSVGTKRVAEEVEGAAKRARTGEGTVLDVLRGIRRAVEGCVSEDGFERMVDVLFWERLEEGAEKRELQRGILEERRLLMSQRMERLRSNMGNG